MTDRPTAPFTIRRLAPDEVAAYRTIRLDALQHAPEAFGSHYDTEVNRPDAAFRDRLAESVVLAAFAGDAIVGMGGLRPNEGPRERHKAFIWGLYVRADHRRRGIAADLIAGLIARIPPGISQITLTVIAGNDGAQALYRHFGFTVYGIEPNALSTDNGFANEVLMVRLATASA